MAATVLSSSKLSLRLEGVSEKLEESFKLQSKLDGVVGKSTVTFGSVSVSKTFRKYFADDEAAILAALWAVAVAVDKSKTIGLADLRTPTTEIAAIIARVETAFTTPPSPYSFPLGS